ncbi:MAG: ParB/RepB/Spo0J family partition protein [Bacteroidetes bacterium]|nr:ParB/RepB/Spo0J family partition protein [Bacteroidota bacterium]
MAKLALGRGLGALLPSDDGEKKVQQVVKEKYRVDETVINTQFITVSSDLIDPNPFQPRTEFDPEALEELKNSIIEHGIIQPLTVRQKPNGRYELIAGERRLRASRLASLGTVPVYILDIRTDEEMLELAIIENIQRKDLNAIEVANGYRRLMEECHLTQDEVAKRVGKDRTTVTNLLRLLKLPDFLQEAIVHGQISMGHARAMLMVSDDDFLKELTERIIREDLSVRAVERLVKAGPVPVKKEPKPVRTPGSASVQDVERRLRTVLSTKVSVREKTKESGSITIEYFSLDELERILDLIESAPHE